MLLDWGQAYNRRKLRLGAFWQDRYHATAVESGEHLGRCTNEFRVNRYSYATQNAPDVAVESNGDFVVAWTSGGDQDGSNYGVFAQRFSAPPVCPQEVDSSCTTGFGKRLFLVKEKVAGQEKLIAKFPKGPTTSQIDLGNPLASAGTSYALCICVGTSSVTTLEVDRAGDATCSGGATACWNPAGTKGYKYKDEALTSDGVLQVQLKSGATKIIMKGKGANLSLPIASAFSSATSVTLQVRGDDTAQCFGTTLGVIKKQETDSFKIK